jgi:hypothetical protein
MGRLQQLKQKAPWREIKRKQAFSIIVGIGSGEPVWHAAAPARSDRIPAVMGARVLRELFFA